MDKMTVEYIESWLKKAESLTPFAVEIRYPDDFHAPTINETQEAYETAKEIRDFVLERIDIYSTPETETQTL